MEQYKREKQLIKRLKQIRLLKKKGKSLRQIGKKFNLSHQRIGQLLMVGYKIRKPMQKKCTICFGVFVTVSNLQTRCPKCSDLFKKKEGRGLTRFLVRLRDNFTCQDCGLVRTDDEVQTINFNKKGLKGRVKALDVHHLNGLCGKKTRAYDKISEVPNLVTLCHKCHYNRPEHKCKTDKWREIISRLKTN